nr:nucleotide pyrophosphohydrolase [Candidatus Sigynarchaeota archaeon]
MEKGHLTLEDLKELLRKFVTDRDWQRFHEPKDLALAASIEVAELGEHFLWKDLNEARDYVKDPVNLDGILEEIADVMIYCMNLVNAIERITGKSINLASAVTCKIEKNEKKYPADLYRNKARLDKPR